MDNATLYPHYVAVAVKVNNPKLAELKIVNNDIIPVSVLVIEKGNDVYELPSARLQSTDKSLEDCAKRAVSLYLGENWYDENTYEPFQEIKTYLVSDKNTHSYIVTAFEVTITSPVWPTPKVDGQFACSWKGLKSVEVSVMSWNHNQVLADIVADQSKLATDNEKPTCETSIATLASETAEKKEIFKNLDRPRQDKVLENLQKMGINAYRHRHQKIATDVVVFGYADDTTTESYGYNELSILLVHRKDKKGRGNGQWALPGTFVHADESAEEAAERALKEKVGKKLPQSYALKPFTNPKRDVVDGVPVISLPFFWIVKKTEVTKNFISDNIDDCQWFTVRRILYAGRDQASAKKVRVGNDVFEKKNGSDEYELVSGRNTCLSIEDDENTDIPLTNFYLKDNSICIEYFQDCRFDTEDYLTNRVETLAFDHADIIIEALETLREQTHFRPLMEGLLPEQFSPTYIQRLWEALVWPQTFNRANFQSAIKIPNNGDSKKNGFIQKVPESGNTKGTALYTFDRDQFEKVLKANRSILK